MSLDFIFLGFEDFSEEIASVSFSEQSHRDFRGSGTQTGMSFLFTFDTYWVFPIDEASWRVKVRWARMALFSDPTAKWVRDGLITPRDGTSRLHGRQCNSEASGRGNRKSQVGT